MIARFFPRPCPLGLSLAAIIVALDQATKIVVLDVWMTPVPRVVEVTGFFNLVLVWNTGVSFGLLAGLAAWMPYLLAGLSLVIAAFLIVWLSRAQHVLPAAALGLVIGGAIGNAVDRLRLGAVADFIDIHAFGWHFWAFNVADAAISVGVALLVIDGLFRTHETS